MIKTRIVVGASGSAGSIEAVRWAAAEARLREADLRVVVAYHRKLPGGPGDPQTAEIVHDAVAAARAAAPEAEVRGVALPGYAVPVLMHAAEAAALLVVGDHRGGGLPGLPLGSVGAQVATQARCSVVVVRGRPGCDTGPVVVGVDDGAAAEAIIGRAFEEASLHGTEVLAVTAGRNGRGAAPSALGADLDNGLGPWREKYPAVPARRAYVDGRPDKVMVQSCEEAQLAVVGPRRHGYQGVLLGAIGTRLLRRAACPVLIAR